MTRQRWFDTCGLRKFLLDSTNTTNLFGEEVINVLANFVCQTPGHRNLLNEVHNKHCTPLPCVPCIVARMSKKAFAQLDKLKPNKKSKDEPSSQFEEHAPTKKSKAEQKAEAAPKAQPSQPSQRAKEAPKSSPKVNTLAHLRCALFSRLLSLP